MKIRFVAFLLLALVVGGHRVWAGPGSVDNPWDSASMLYQSPKVDNTSFSLVTLPSESGRAVTLGCEVVSHRHFRHLKKRRHHRRRTGNSP